jgi:pyridoxine 5-phosphate synthase
MKLGVNIDHIATVRQARYAGQIDAHNAEPDPVAAAALCERAGCHGITAHLRADRRHVQDRDIFRLRESILTKLNLEMGNTREILDIALKIQPDEVCLVPENRQEISTEGGLDCVMHREALEPTIKRLQAIGTRVSLFIEPSPDQIETAHALGVEIIELHTGAFANAQGKTQQEELRRLKSASDYATNLGLQVNAGHGINYTNIALIRKIPHLAELNIGHSIVSRAIIVGLENAVREMLAAMNSQ